MEITNLPQGTKSHAQAQTQPPFTRSVSSLLCPQRSFDEIRCNRSQTYHCRANILNGKQIPFKIGML